MMLIGDEPQSYPSYRDIALVLVDLVALPFQVAPPRANGDQPLSYPSYRDIAGAGSNQQARLQGA